MSTTYTYKSISNLSDATNINQNDILLISQVENNQLISKKTTINKIVSDVVWPLIDNNKVDYLPLSAGQTNVVNGTIYSSSPYATLRYNNKNTPMRIIAGPYESNSQNDWLPAELVLYHSGNPTDTYESRFELHVHRLQGSDNTKYTTTLRGTCDGKLTWDTKNIVRSVNNKEATIDGNCIIGITDISNLYTELNNRPLSSGLIDKANQLNNARTISLIGNATGSAAFDGSTDISINVNVLSSASAAQSDKLKTLRTINLSGDLSGSFSFDGSEHITANISVNNNSHTHIIDNISDLQLSLDNKYNKSDFSIKDDTLSNNINDNKNIPTCKAVVDYCNNNFISCVEVQQHQSIGTKLATIRVNDISTDIYGSVNLSSGLTNVGIGSIIAFAGEHIPDNTLLCDGSEVSRTAYADLYSIIGNKYGEPSNDDNFKLPDLNNRFIQGITDSISVGQYISAGLPNIYGELPNTRVYSNPSGPFIKQDDGHGYDHTTTDYASNDSLIFDASNANSIYGNSETVQPPALTLKYVIIYKQLNGGNNINSDCASYIISSQYNSINQTWYRVYSDGFIEQGGYVKESDFRDDDQHGDNDKWKYTLVNYPKSFNSMPYTINITLRNTTTSYPNAQDNSFVSRVGNSSFEINVDRNMNGAYWTASGY